MNNPVALLTTVSQIIACSGSLKGLGGISNGCEEWWVGGRCLHANTTWL